MDKKLKRRKKKKKENFLNAWGYEFHSMKTFEFVKCIDYYENNILVTYVKNISPLTRR